MIKRFHHEGRLQFPKTYYIVDPEIVSAMIQKESYGFTTFVAVHVAEIQGHTNPQNWYWIDPKSNIADWITRGHNLKSQAQQKHGIMVLNF